MLRLRAAATPNPRLEPVLDGEVRDPHLELEWTRGHPGELFPRHVRSNDFDLFEFSLSVYLRIRCAERPPALAWEALPVFLAKTMLPFDLCVRRGSSIRSWRDLGGRRIGVPDVHMTAAVWLRIMLRELFGIEPGDVAWVNGRSASARHSAAAGAASPRGLAVDELPEGESLQSLLEAGEIDAAFGDHAAVSVTESDRSEQLLDLSGRQQLLETFAERTGATPVNHVFVVQRAVIDRDPDVAGRLVALFEAGKLAAYDRFRVDGRALQFPDDGVRWSEEVFGRDPYPSGLEANRRSLDLLLEELSIEGQLEQRVPVASLFLDV